MPQDVLTISELNQFIKDVINSGFPQPVWICGEIQGYDRNKDRNHIFFELLEKDPQSKDVLARIGLVIFANRKFQIESVLRRSENAFTLKDDIEVKFACRVDFYAPHGAVRLIVEDIDPTYTLGKIAQEKQRLIALLKEKGVLDKNKTRELPTVPLKIGLITAYDSAAYNDFISELKKSGFSFTIYLRDCLVQGKKAESDIAQGIEELNRIKGLDVIVITRGGGSISDLSCFDSELIANKIAESHYAVVSGIGHEINTTITDLAAHTYAKTPTAIANFLVERIQSFLDSLEEKISRVFDLAQEKVRSEAQRLKSSAIDLQNSTHQYLNDHNKHLIRLIEMTKHKPQRIIEDGQRSLLDNQDLLKKTINTRLYNDQTRLESYRKIIDIVHPHNTMKRGFSIARNKDGKVIKSTKDIREKEQMVTELMDGMVRSQVI